MDSRIVVKKEEVPQERSRRTKPPLAKGRPDVGRVADRLFDSVVVVVAERRSHSRLKLDCGYQLTV
jgi:hypothetical protein